MTHHVATFPDGSQVWIEQRDDGTVWVASRDDRAAVWGIQIEADSDG